MIQVRRGTQISDFELVVDGRRPGAERRLGDDGDVGFERAVEVLAEVDAEVGGADLAAIEIHLHAGHVHGHVHRWVAGEGRSRRSEPEGEPREESSHQDAYRNELPHGYLPVGAKCAEMLAGMLTQPLTITYHSGLKNANTLAITVNSSYYASAGWTSSTSRGS